MKRSEMITKLTEFVRNSTNWCFDDSLMFTQELLDKIEDDGMEPPEYRFWNSPDPKDVNEKGIPKILNYHSRNGDYIHAWEPENEKK